MAFKLLFTAYWTLGKTGSALVPTSGDMTSAVESAIRLSVCAALSWLELGNKVYPEIFFSLLC